MNKEKLRKIGVVGAIVTAVCCFTPLLVGLLALIGLSSVIGYLDWVLFPALFMFVGLIIYSWPRKDSSDG